MPASAAPVPAVSLATQRHPFTRGDPGIREVAITFDACATRKGWYGFDRDVFEILERQKVPATIFVSGRWVDTHPEAMADLTNDPLIEFGDHSYDHPHMTQLSVARMNDEIDQTEAALSRYGRHSVAFRPPFGDWNRRVLETVQGRQLPTVTWDVVSGDPSAKITTAHMIRAVLGQARAGSVIIFHINGRGWKTHEALLPILEGLRARGFRLVPLSTLLKPGAVPTVTTVATPTAVAIPVAPTTSARP
ncbi:MAG TPA: polysaccharide deacetylase family protein [Polyangia bacterium]|nr:polysaccharide deacetylase family protein [Polyangia bacterium]